MIMRERSNIEEAIQNFLSLEEGLKDSTLMIELAEKEKDEIIDENPFNFFHFIKYLSTKTFELFSHFLFYDNSHIIV